MDRTDPLDQALAMMRGDDEYFAGTNERAHEDLIRGEVSGDPRVSALLDTVNAQYAKNQYQDRVIDAGGDYAANFGLDAGEVDPHLNAQVAAYNRDQVMQSDVEGAEPDWDIIKRLMYGMPQYDLDNFTPEVYSPTEDYLSTMYPNQDNRALVRGMIEDGTHDFDNPPRHFASDRPYSGREMAADFAMDSLGFSRRAANNLTGSGEMGIGLADFTPMGLPLAIDDAVTSFKNGDYGGAAINAGFGALSLPSLKATAHGGRAMIRKASERWR